MIKERFFSALLGTILVAVFQPFGISQFGWMKFILFLGIFLITFFSCVVSEYVVRYLLRMPNDEDRGPAYTRRRGLSFQACNVLIMPILFVFFLHYFATNDVVDNSISWKTYLWSLGVCLGVSFIMGLYWRNVYMKRYLYRQLEEAQLINGMLMERSRQSEKTELSAPRQELPILIEGTTKESLQIMLSEFLFAESEGNYVMVHHLKEGQHQQTMLRTSIKNIVSVLCVNQEVMQCHRAFVVNLKNVEKVENRSSGLGLKMKNCDNVVSVSKSYANEVKEMIKNPLHS